MSRLLVAAAVRLPPTATFCVVMLAAVRLAFFETVVGPFKVRFWPAFRFALPAVDTGLLAFKLPDLALTDRSPRLSTLPCVLMSVPAVIVVTPPARALPASVTLPFVALSVLLPTAVVAPTDRFLPALTFKLLPV
ncbi:hypothetical protein WK27_22035 [Burkholderia vietnamiensis]|nr:hypothetical protein WK27_22035 [Burkholderia vietnamiensis]